MSKAPESCFYCDGDGYNNRANTPCGFCSNGVPLDTQKDWDRSWGMVDYIFVCPQRHDLKMHRVKWNSGSPHCLTCDIAAVAVITPTLVRDDNAS